MTVQTDTVFRRLVCLLVFAVSLTACSEENPTEDTADKPITKIAEIYYRYALELAAEADTGYKAMLEPAAIAAGAQCVQNEIVSKGVGAYRQPKLRSLILDHIFPEDLSTYARFTDDARVQAGAEERLKALGFESYDAAVQSNNMIARGLLAEYSYYARFRSVHNISRGIKPENLVLNLCAESSLGTP